MFGRLKKGLREEVLVNKELLAKRIAEISFGFNEIAMQTFFRKTLNNMIEYLGKLKIDDIIS